MVFRSEVCRQMVAQALFTWQGWRCPVIIGLINIWLLIFIEEFFEAVAILFSWQEEEVEAQVVAPAEINLRVG